MDKTLVATVTSTGQRYIVQRRYFGKGPNDPDKVYCWGEVNKVVQKGRALQTTHDHNGKTFLASAVTVTEVVRDSQLLRELFDQRTRSLRAAGHVLYERTTRNGGKRVTDHGTPEHQARVRAAGEGIRDAFDDDLNRALTAVFRRSQHT